MTFLKNLAICVGVCVVAAVCLSYLFGGALFIIYIDTLGPFKEWSGFWIGVSRIVFAILWLALAGATVKTVEDLS